MSKKFAIMVDNTCELSDQLLKEYDIEMIMGHYTTPDGKEHDAINSWSPEERDQFYKDLKRDPDGYKTSPPNTQECFIEFEKHAKAGIGLLVLCISTGISGTYSFMSKAQEEIKAKYPEAELYIVDTLRFGPAAGLMATYASDLRKEGKSIKEVFDWLEENKNHFHQTGWMDDLSFVAKKGRITHAKAFFGSLIGIKPIGEFDYNGLTTVIGKGKGEKQTIEILLQYIEEFSTDIQNQIVFIATSNRHKQAETFKQLIIEKFHPKAVYINDVMPNCGINVGPGLMAAYYYGKPISQDLVQETEAIKKIMEKVGK